MNIVIRRFEDNDAVAAAELVKYICNDLLCCDV